MKKQLGYILFLISTIYSYGQVTLGVSEVKEQRVNQRFTLTVMLEIAGENMEQQSRLRLPDISKFDYVGSASEQNTVVIDASRNNVINQLLYQVVLVPKQAGKIKFGSVLVTVNNKIYKTEPFDIVVRDAERSTGSEFADKNDVFLDLEVTPKEVYKNQPAVAVLRAYSRNYNNFRKVGSVHVGSQKSVRMKPVTLEKSEIDVNSGMGSQVIGVFVVFPSEAGTIEIKPLSAAVDMGGAAEKVLSAPAKLAVKKLPAGMPAGFKNAVGKFKISATSKSETENAETEKPLTVALSLSGSGNMDEVSLPKIAASENYTSYPPKIITNITTGHKTMSGTITAEYVVVPKKPGNFAVQFEPFSYFDPATAKYTDLGVQEVLLRVKTQEQIAEEKTAIEKVNDYTNTVLETVNTPVLQTRHLKVADKAGINWSVILGNMTLVTGFAALLFLGFRRRGRRKVMAASMVPQPTVTTIAETEVQLRDQLGDPVKENLAYAGVLLDRQDIAGFFSVQQELHQAMCDRLGIHSQEELMQSLRQNFGSSLAEKYRQMLYAIQIEKYAPEASLEALQKIKATMNELYPIVKK